ncbi:hypothetical protein SynMVIR181_00616 [Synechococcus sp. MVIR-18-1]|nr:hypothetical protein SynMVIR181_00616 [Synechococcus sp. MVIR-18-1]
MVVALMVNRLNSEPGQQLKQDMKWSKSGMTSNNSSKTLDGNHLNNIRLRDVM